MGKWERFSIFDSEIVFSNEESSADAGIIHI